MRDSAVGDRSADGSSSPAAIAAAGTRRPSVALDTACGSGQLSVALTQCFDHVIGVDTNVAQIACATPHGSLPFPRYHRPGTARLSRARTTDDADRPCCAPERLSYVAGDATALPIRSHSCDALTVAQGAPIAMRRRSAADAAAAQLTDGRSGALPGLAGVCGRVPARAAVRLRRARSARRGGRLGASRAIARAAQAAWLRCSRTDCRCCRRARPTSCWRGCAGGRRRQRHACTANTTRGRGAALSRPSRRLLGRVTGAHRRAVRAYSPAGRSASGA